MTSQDSWRDSQRLGGLRRFALAITIFNVLGHFYFGFEQSYAQPLCALATAYVVEILLELVDATANRRKPRFAGSAQTVFDFLLSAHITGLAVAMLLYTNETLWPTVFATAAAIGSKTILRAKNGRHIFNPSNFGIALTLTLFPWVGIAPPYHFSENLPPIGRWLLPTVIVFSGTYLNARFTKRLPLIAAWVVGFGAQALIRSSIYGARLIPSLLPMTGIAFILFTFYMVTDPATTPGRLRSQLVFGSAVSVAYGLLVTFHVVFGLFFALVSVCCVRLIVSYALVPGQMYQPASRHAIEDLLATRAASSSGPVLLEKIDT
jgi:Na+-translocating ferredoxin:NAD+ oxidoreductase RnfD subunit